LAGGSLASERFSVLGQRREQPHRSVAGFLVVRRPLESLGDRDEREFVLTRVDRRLGPDQVLVGASPIGVSKPLPHPDGTADETQRELRTAKPVERGSEIPRIGGLIRVFVHRAKVETEEALEVRAGDELRYRFWIGPPASRR
jgi:hypothetical protein